MPYPNNQAQRNANELVAIISYNPFIGGAAFCPLPGQGGKGKRRPNRPSCPHPARPSVALAARPTAAPTWHAHKIRHPECLLAGGDRWIPAGLGCRGMREPGEVGLVRGLP